MGPAALQGGRETPGASASSVATIPRHSPGRKAQLGFADAEMAN